MLTEWFSLKIYVFNKPSYSKLSHKKFWYSLMEDVGGKFTHIMRVVDLSFLLPVDTSHLVANAVLV